jgi:trans-aconitate 2-methyltransferase
MTWDANLYLRFGDERTRPAIDLASRINVASPASVVDLGCGPGNSTQVLAQRWPEAAVSGLDNSADMIAAARGAHPDQSWSQIDIAQWAPDAPVDVVFSNAALQWLGDHGPLVRRLFSAVASGGALAFQIPSDLYSPIRVMIDEVAEDPAWSARMVEARGALTMHAPAFYYDVLADAARSLDIWETEYSHVMEGHSAIVEWITSTGLRPYLAPLTDAERSRFLTLLAQKVAEGYPLRSDGRVLFPFRRIFVIAYA